MRYRIRNQLLLPVALLLAGVAAISLTTAVVSARQARAQIEARLRDAARFLVEESNFPLQSDVLQKLRPLSGAEYLLVPPLGPRQTSLPRDPGGFDLPVADDWQSLTLETPVEIEGTNYLGGGVRLLRPPNAGDTLFIFYPESQWRDARRHAIWPSLVLGICVGVTALGLALAQASRLGRRIQELERRTRSIADGDFSPIPLPGRDDEIRDLARSVNEMAQRLAQFQNAVRQTERLRILGQVSGGLAHQLRNGLTGARLAVQLFLTEIEGGIDVTPLEVALRQLALLETHVKRFLDLGRAGPARREPCDLVALVGEAVELVRPQCRHAGIELLWQPAGASPASGDAGQLGQVLVNLLGNAVEAAGPGGRVEVRVEGRRVEVYDSGPGPAGDVAERLFEPFVTGKPEGVGLGLAVAKQIVEGHGGRIGWERVEGRTCFRLELGES